MSDSDKDEPRDPPVPVLQEDGSLLIRKLPNGDQLVASKGWVSMSEMSEREALVAAIKKERRAAGLHGYFQTSETDAKYRAAQAKTDAAVRALGA